MSSIREIVAKAAQAQQADFTREAQLSVKGYLKGVEKALTTWSKKDISADEKKLIENLIGQLQKI